MQTKGLGITIAVVLLLFLPNTLDAQGHPRGVVKVIFDGCTTQPTRRTQTGFILDLKNGLTKEGIDSRPGIITALHGVLGNCAKRYALSTSKGVLTPLEVEQVDIENDVALLHFAGTLPEGLPLTKHYNLALINEVRASGYPRGTGQITIKAFLHEPKEQRLSQIVDSKMSEYLALRQSPDLNTSVMSLGFGQQPGLSGAPILDSHEDRVFAIAGSGLASGTAGLNWAVPLNRIKLRPKSEVESELQRIVKESSPEPLFGDAGSSITVKIGQKDIAFVRVPRGTLRRVCRAEEQTESPNTESNSIKTTDIKIDEQNENCATTPWVSVEGEDVPAFLIAETETTNEQYSECVHLGQCKKQPQPFLAPRAPMAIKDSKKAEKFCAALTPHGRLPKETEWRFAALEAGWSEIENSSSVKANSPKRANRSVELKQRRASTCAMNLEGKSQNRGCSDNVDTYNREAEVRRFPSNRLGLYDMFGNVAELAVAKDGHRRIVLGGSFASSPKNNLLAPTRLADMPNDQVGFRCIVELHDDER